MDTAIVQLMAAKKIIHTLYSHLKIVYSKKSKSKVKGSSVKFDCLEGDENWKGKIRTTMALLLSCTYILWYFYPRCPLKNHWEQVFFYKHYVTFSIFNFTGVSTNKPMLIESFFFFFMYLCLAHQRQSDPKTDQRGDGRAGGSSNVPEHAPWYTDSVSEETWGERKSVTECSGTIRVSHTSR